MKNYTWFANWNMCGYMPDNDAAEFDTFEEAKNYIISVIKEFEEEEENENTADNLCYAAEEINLENDEFSYIVNHYCFFVIREETN